MAEELGKLVATALESVAASGGQSTGRGNTQRRKSPLSEAEHRLHFINTFYRWENLFKRRDGEEAADEWLLAEYYDSLRHLSCDDLNRLTRAMKGQLTFFPSIAECLKHVPVHYDTTSVNAIGSPAWWEAHRIERAEAQAVLPDGLKSRLAELKASLPSPKEGTE